MHQLEKRPMLILVIGILGISLSSILVKYSPAPSVVTAAWRLSWTVILMTPAVLGRKETRRELLAVPRTTALLSLASGVFLAIHFATWFESLKLTSVASSTTIVCTEVIWVCLGYCLFLKGKITKKAGLAIAVTLLGSVLVAWSDSARGHGLRGDLLALAAAVAVAVYTLLGRIVRSSASTTVYTYLVYTACTAALLTMCAVQGHGLTDWGMAAHPGGTAAGSFLHHSGAQHLLLVPEILLSHLCFGLQALRAGGGGHPGGLPVRGDPGAGAAAGGRADPGRCGLVFPAGNAILIKIKNWVKAPLSPGFQM